MTRMTDFSQEFTLFTRRYDLFHILFVIEEWIFIEEWKIRKSHFIWVYLRVEMPATPTKKDYDCNSRNVSMQIWRGVDQYLSEGLFFHFFGGCV